MGLSSCLILLGSGLIYSYTGLTNLESIYSLFAVYNSEVLSSSSPRVDGGTFLSTIFVGYSIYNGVILGFLLVLSGFLFKIAASPFHNWAPAWHSGKMPLWDKLSNSGKALKLFVTNKLVRCLYQSLRNCFKPYRALLSLIVKLLACNLR